MRTIAIAAALALAAGGAAGSGGTASAAAPAGVAAMPAPGVIDAEAARRLVAAGVRVVDVRTPEEYAEGHVPGALNIPFDELALRHGEIGPPATPVLLYCRSGRRSAIAADTLAAQGFSAVWDMKTWRAWQASEAAAGSAGH